MSSSRYDADYSFRLFDHFVFCRTNAFDIPRIFLRQQELGFSASDLRLTLAWLLAGAPTIIHLDLHDVLDYLVDDTHYRNQFE